MFTKIPRLRICLREQVIRESIKHVRITVDRGCYGEKYGIPVAYRRVGLARDDSEFTLNYVETCIFPILVLYSYFPFRTANDDCDDGNGVFLLQGH